jgi:hypothetical protein
LENTKPKSSKLQYQQEKIKKKNLINQEQLKLKFIIYHPDFGKIIKALNGLTKSCSLPLDLWIRSPSQTILLSNGPGAFPTSLSRTGFTSLTALGIIQIGQSRPSRI